MKRTLTGSREILIGDGIVLRERLVSGFARPAGFSLLELLLVMTIVAVLAGLAIPGYQASVLRSNRTVARAGLMELVNRQTLFYLNNRNYTDDLTELGYPASLVVIRSGRSAIALDNRQSPVESDGETPIYLLEIESADDTGFSVSAIPQRSQSNDSDCGAFTVDHTGAQSISGTGRAADCW